MMEYRDYYNTLGIARDADADDIKQAYRRMARRYHPDVSQEADAEERFKEINEAYEVLGTPDKRRKYDRIAPSARQESSPRTASPHTTRRQRFDPAYFEEISRQDVADTDSGFSDFFESLFGKKSKKKQDKTDSKPNSGTTDTSIELDIADLFRDTVKTVQISSTESIQVRIPKGASNGQKLRLPGKGSRGSDLSLVIQVRPHPYWQTQELDIYIDCPIAPWEAALGASIPLPTPTGTVNLKIPPGSQSGKKMRLLGRGLPRQGDSTVSGDLYVILQIQTPPATNAAEQALYQHMSQLFSWHPRSHMN
ncbi:MAG: DnaJ C-terminal domain-containing protein [Thiolinea sp.]